MRRLSLGNDEPSGSPVISRLPVNSVIALPSALVTMNPSCFSAVMLVIGKKMCEKNLTPFCNAQSLMAAATMSAVAASSGAPVCTVSLIACWRTSLPLTVASCLLAVCWSSSKSERTETETRRILGANQFSRRSRALHMRDWWT